MDNTEYLLTTIGGQEFYEIGLGHFKPLSKTIGLPGLGVLNTRMLKNVGISSAEQIFGLYLMLGREKNVFLDYLENEIGVKFVNGDTYKNALCDTLEAKWKKIKEY